MPFGYFEYTASNESSKSTVHDMNTHTAKLPTDADAALAKISSQELSGLIGVLGISPPKKTKSAESHKGIADRVSG